MKRRPFRRGDIVCYKGSDRLYTVMENEEKIGRSYFFKFFSNTGFSDGYARASNYRLVCAVEDRKDMTKTKIKWINNRLKLSEK